MGAASLDPQCSDRGRAGLPGWGSAVHAEKREIKNTVVLGSQQQSVAEQLKKNFCLIVETEETTCSEDVQCLVKTPP